MKVKDMDTKDIDGAVALLNEISAGKTLRARVSSIFMRCMNRIKLVDKLEARRLEMMAAEEIINLVRQNGA